MLSRRKSFANDQNLKKRRKLILPSWTDSDEEVKPIETIASKLANNSHTRISEENCNGFIQPLEMPIWRGSFNIQNQNLSTLDGLAAHLSSKSCSKVFQFATLLPSSLCLEMLPKTDVWPRRYDKSPPTDNEIALYFFPRTHKLDEVYESLLNNMFSKNIAMRTVVDNTELLVFTSLELSPTSWRLEGKYYLWGAITDKVAFPSSQRADHVTCQHRNTKNVEPSNPEIDGGSVEQRNLTKDSNTAADSAYGEERSLAKAADTESPIKSKEPTPERDLIMLKLNQKGGGTSSPDRFSSQTIATSILDMAKAFTEPNPDETSSADNSMTQVGPYSVLPSLGPILEAIIAKYGDIAQDCPYKSVSLRSSFLEALCNDIKMLQKVPFTRLKDHHLKSLKSTLTDAESAKLDVKWLRDRLDELTETMHLLKQYDKLKEALTKGNEATESKKIVIDSKKANMMKLKSEIQSLENNLGLRVAKTEELDSIMSNVAKECKCFQISLVDELL